MPLPDYGYTEQLEQSRQELGLGGFEIGRVIAEHKERYEVATEEGDIEAEITGNMRFTAESREDYPAVGDWVAITRFDTRFGIIHSILPRKSLIKRRMAGSDSEVQVIAANVDVALIVQAVDRDYNPNRLERYLTLCHASGVEPIVILTKIDLMPPENLDSILASLHARIPNVPVIPISNYTQAGLINLKSSIINRQSYVLLGSSGVGKSTLLNNLMGEEVMRTAEISDSIQRGRHVTTHRELMLLPGGGILIDNPGMREVGLADTGTGLEITFDEILSRAGGCRYPDCTHIHETGCAILAAVESGEIDNAAYQNYLKMEKERRYLESSIEEKRRKDRMFGKMMKNYKKGR